MSTERAIVLLNSQKPAERLAGARMLLAQRPRGMRVAVIRKFRADENDSWVQVALDRVIDEWERPRRRAPGRESASAPDTLEVEDVRADAIQDVTQVVLHEIRPLMTDVKDAVRSGMGAAYSGSEAEAYVERMRTFLDTIRELHDAAGSPQKTEVDLSDVIAQEIRFGRYDVNQVVLVRAEPVIAIADPGLLKLALANVIRNAVEASSSTARPVVINLGANESSAWISILDDGVGLPEDNASIWDAGNSQKSKETNFGWGLYITERALTSMGAKIALIPREHGGTAAEISWDYLEETEVAP